MSYRIRTFEAADLQRLKEITAVTFGPVSIDGGMEKLFGRFGKGDWRSRKAEAIAADCAAQPDGVFVMVDEKNHPVGYITTRLSEESGIGWIPNLAVDPAHQGHGLGRKLIEHAIQFFRERKMQVAKIETLAHNEIGQKLYPSIGFQEVSRQIHYAMKL